MSQDSNPILRRIDEVDMAEPTLTKEMKRHAVIVSLAAGHTDSETVTFLKVAPSFVFIVRRELEAAKGDVVKFSQRKQHCRRSDSIRTFKSRVQAAIDEDPGKLMRELTREVQVDEATHLSIEGDVSTYFTPGSRVNALAYTEVLATVIKPWIAAVARGRPYVIQQDSAPSHTARTTQEWMAENLHDHVTPNVWPPAHQMSIRWTIQCGT
ncbi:hypothetical protein LAZ67_7003540 [Cordylochernes scorpioides]|uniref:Transposase n=1 Tax=Cordylochernes scorpioides TaxID=51811 RepID=A0ABY6KP13_9ARAC|nr:hypothetical protein LAZ67_7003540 [Cordylochernes scorpioides]